MRINEVERIKRTVENEIIEKMTDKINSEIKWAVAEFAEWNENHQRKMAKIEGMIDMLVLITGKDYVMTDTGIGERG